MTRTSGRVRLGGRRWTGPAVLVGLLLCMVLLAGCGTRSGAGETAAAATQAQALGVDPPLVLDLPAIRIDYDADGKPHLGEVAALEDFGGLLPPALLSQLTLEPALVRQLQAANIQHVQISNTPRGLRLLVNGEALPTVAWDKESLAGVLDLLRQSNNPGLAGMAELLPVVTDLGTGVTVSFPPAPGVAAIPLTADRLATTAEQAQAAEQAFLDRVGAQPAIRIPVYYTADGTWTVANLSDTRWQALTGLPFGYLRLNPDLIADAVRAGVTEVTLRTDAEGIHLEVGDRTLPYLRWADGGLATAIKLAQQFDVVQLPAGSEPLVEQLLAQWLPALQTTDVEIHVFFPPQ